MSIQARRGTDAVPYALTKALNDGRLLAQDQNGTATLAAGTVTVSNVTLLQGSNIQVSKNTPGGATQGVVNAPAANRTTGLGTGSFVINATSLTNALVNTDTSTVDWRITHAFFHGDCTCNTTGDPLNPQVVQLQTQFPTNAVDLPTSIALVNSLKAACVQHALDTAAHKAADTTNQVTLSAVANAIDLASSITLVNAVKVFFNAHLTQAGVHVNNDTFNNVATANASDLPTTQTLANALKAALVLHIPHAPSGESVGLLQ